jgi:hypothetical protein
MSQAGEFIDAALQREALESRAIEDFYRLGSPSELRFYGASVGAIRGTLRDLGRGHRPFSHDEVTALSSELWAVPVFERRLAAIVLLQSHAGLLIVSDLTRLEHFLRLAEVVELAEPLVREVLGPLVESLDAASRSRAVIVIDRWSADENPWLRYAAGELSADPGRSTRR